MSEKCSPMPPVAGKSKQERIRDNQRRSRARRQEYLTELEQRLSECHITCRDANLQKDTFTQLQLENLRLRELLAFAGVSSDVVENYVLQDAGPKGGSESALRHLKPKLSSAQSAAPVLTKPNSNCRPRGCGQGDKSCSKDIDAATRSAPSEGSKVYGTLLSDESFQDYSAMTVALPDAARMPAHSSNVPDNLPLELQPTEFDWMFQQQVEDELSVQTLSSSCGFGDQFPLATHSPLMSDSGSVPLCSAAKHLIDHHHITPNEMTDIRTWSDSHDMQVARPDTESGPEQQVLLSHELDGLRNGGD